MILDDLETIPHAPPASAICLPSVLYEHLLTVGMVDPAKRRTKRRWRRARGRVRDMRRRGVGPYA